MKGKKNKLKRRLPGILYLSNIYLTRAQDEEDKVEIKSKFITYQAMDQISENLR